MSYRSELANYYCDAIHAQRMDIMSGVILNRELIKEQFRRWLHYGLRWDSPSVDLMTYLKEVPSLLDNCAVGEKSIRESIWFCIEEDFSNFAEPYVERAFERQYKEDDWASIQ